jgi:hypothetical protein
MCRNIKPLHNFTPPATEQEIHEAALQFVRKISGTPKPSARNADVFHAAVTDISNVVTRLLAGLETSAPPKNRDVEAERARARSRARFNREQPGL